MQVVLAMFDKNKDLLILNNTNATIKAKIKKSFSFHHHF
ncbi:hypothetical protein RAMDARK_1982 [Rickettsia amblyommatis str. Darkwater]|nr:hypothetical protein RAMDARK_1982 [Rickettsia amblyommatis str. Darkwater]